MFRKSARLIRACNSTPSEVKEVIARKVPETLTARTPIVFDHGFDEALLHLLLLRKRALKIGGGYNKCNRDSSSLDPTKEA